MVSALIAEGSLRRVKAQVMKTFGELPMTAQESEAYASEFLRHRCGGRGEGSRPRLKRSRQARAHARLTIDIWRRLKRRTASCQSTRRELNRRRRPLLPHGDKLLGERGVQRDGRVEIGFARAHFHRDGKRLDDLGGVRP